MGDQTSATWDTEADTFDDAADHGLADPGVRRAWVRLLTGVLPPPPARVLDIGTGTGTLAVLLAELGHDVTGVDFAPRMIERAKQKARRHQVKIKLRVGNASQPPAVGKFEVVLARHVLWALSVPGAALDTWIQLMAPTGRLVLIEGFWRTGAGMTAAELLPLVDARMASSSLRSLSNHPELWGGPVDDERYLITATAARSRHSP